MVIVVAVVVVAVLGFAALVVDVGAAFVERRQDQTAADAAVLAGAAHLFISRSAAAQTAKSMARDNLRQVFTDQQWNDLWAGCSDPLAFPVASTISACLSFNSANTRMRVQLPDAVVKTTFGKSLGTASLRTSAAAEAEVEPPAGGGILPFGLIDYGANLNNQMCAKSPATCGGDSSDDLRIIDSPFYGNPQYGTTQLCRPTGYDTRIANNSAVGMDHTTVPFGGPLVPGSGLLRSDDCGVELPNAVWGKDFQTYAGSPQYPSFLAGLGRGVMGVVGGVPFTDGKPARLQRIPNSTWSTRVVGGLTLDNRPLWDFIPASLTSGIPISCYRSAFNAPNNTKSQMSKCLSDYVTGVYTTPLFSQRSAGTPADLYDIQLSARLAFAAALLPPVVTPDLYPILAYHLTFIETLYLGGGTACSPCQEFNPGESNTLTLSQFAGMSAFKVLDNMVPKSVLETGPFGSLRGARVALIR